LCPVHRILAQGTKMCVRVLSQEIQILAIRAKYDRKHRPNDKSKQCIV